MTQDDAREAPSVIVFAGPNGSGKSTITKALNRTDFKGEYINADDIAKSLEPQIPDYLQRNLAAARMAEERRISAMKEGKAFAFETVMSTPEKVAIMTQAKAAGYSVSLVFVTTSDPDINVQRVANRVALNGHDVDPATVRERYHKTMALLPAALEHANAASVYDNSKDMPYEVAIKRDNQLHLHNDAARTPWVAEKLVRPYVERMASRRELESAFDKLAQTNPSSLPAVLRDADASNGKKYGGQIVALTDKHALQQTGANVFVIHDRSLMAPKDLQLGKQATIQYAYDKGKLIDPGLYKPTPARGIER